MKPKIKFMRGTEFIDLTRFDADHFEQRLRKWVKGE